MCEWIKYLISILKKGVVGIPILKDLPMVKKILTREMELIKNQISNWVYVSENGRKALQKGSITFYFVEVHVERVSHNFVYSEYDPFIVKDGDSFQLNKKYTCYCTFVKSPVEFTLVFEEHIPTILSGRINKINPSGNIERQIALVEGLEAERSKVKKDLRYKKSNRNHKEAYLRTMGSFHSYLLTFPVSFESLDREEYSRYCYVRRKSDSKINFTNKSLTEKQKKAIVGAIQSQSFHLIHGPPGTGKTTVITDIILNLIAEGNKVLVCSWMNVAVDNILEKLLKSKQIEQDEIARISAGTFKVSKDVQTILLSNLAENRINNFKVVGSTLASAHLSRGLNEDKLFDVVIIDEAGASTIPQTLLALCHAKKFILVGDHYQLPPILQVTPENSGISSEYIDAMKISLFEYMVERWSNSSYMTVLDTQYRMEETIAELSNILVYNDIGRLKTGTDTTKNSFPPSTGLTIKASNIPVKSHDELKKILCKEYPLIWLNAEGRHEWDTLLKSSSGPRSAYNRFEVDVIKGLYDFLRKTLPSLKNEQIGIIATYRKQVEKLNEIFGDETLNGLEISTVDSFQGKEKEIIIFSTVYAPQTLMRKNKGSPNIFKDKRRFNVAFTRAKYKLIMVGDIELVRRDVEYFKDAYKHIRDAYGDPNNNYCKRGIIKDYELCEYFEKPDTKN